MASYNTGIYGSSASSALAQVDGTNPTSRRLSTNLAQRGEHKNRALLDALIGAASGSNVTKTESRVKHQTAPGNNNQGGKMIIETDTVINRNTAASDVTNLKAIVTRAYKPSTYVADRSGNGSKGN